MIATEAGVSQPVVSQVLNGLGDTKKISKKTQEKVLLTAKKMNYRRNAIAQSMKTGKTNVIGLIGGWCSSYSMEIIKGINNTVLKNNYLIKLLSAENTEEIKNAARQCVEQRLAGVICRSLTEANLEILRTELVPNNIPIVLVDSSFSHDWCSRVISDDFEGAKLATEYLLKLGHRKIGHITNSLTLGFAKIRYDGYLETMKNTDGFDVEKNVYKITDDGYEVSNLFREEITNFINRFKPTAVFCGSDPIAMKVTLVASELGLKIPEDLSIIGYAGLEYSAISNPPLTTIAQKFEKMGQKASEILLSEIKKKSPIKEIKLPVELIIRNSVQVIK